MPTLIEKLHAVHDSLGSDGIAHAFGGAIALAYCTEEPRGTRDIDVNVFIDAERADRATAALPSEVVVSETDLQALRSAGQARLWWGDTPIDLFLNNHPLHKEVARGVRWVPLAGRDVPVLDCRSLAIFKALFDRTKDWADIEAIAEVNPEIVEEAAERLEQLTRNPEDQAVLRLHQIAKTIG